MIKIGRNDLCSCKSGKKFKNCCLERKYLEDLEKQNLIYYDENYMVSELMKESKSFYNFYSTERNKIHRELLWFRKTDNLGANMSYGSIPIANNPYAIAGKTSPVSIEYAIDTAHELQHLICCEEGFKIIAFKEGCNRISEKLCKIISDMLNDPIVNSRIVKYGFNLVSYHKRADEIQMRTIGTNSREITLITTLYVKKTLDMRILYPLIKPNDIEFNKWIEKYYSNLVPTSKQILRIVEEIGYDDPQKTEVILNKVIDLLGLSDVLTVKNL